MTREGTRPFAALVVAVLAAALLAACGGSDSDSTGSTEPASTSGAATSNTGAQNGEGGARDGGGDSSQDGAKAGDGSPARDAQTRDEQDSDSGSSSKDVETPLEVSGGGSEQFRSKGGDNSIQEYGEEGDESELREVAEIVHGFYVARAEEDWAKACSYLAKSNIEQLEQLASQSPQLKDAGCGPVLKAFTRTLPAEIQREITTVDAGSFRHEDDQGFLIYYGADRTVYAMPLREEDGSWKVAALSGTTLG